MNIVLWVVWASKYADLTSDYTRWHLVLSGIFTAVCAFRSFWPRIDLERFCIVDSYASSMVFGRTAATIAEISFATQVALMVDEYGTSLNVEMQPLSYATVALLTTAQVFCWFGVLTCNHLWHAIEESLWALTFAMVGGTLFWNRNDASGLWITVSNVGWVVCLLYVAFMVIVDVPMYLSRWWSGEHDGGRLGFGRGFSDALHRRVPTLDWKVWKPEVAWLTGYFWLAVWFSVGMAALPR